MVAACAAALEHQVIVRKAIRPLAQLKVGRLIGRAQLALTGRVMTGGVHMTEQFSGGLYENGVKPVLAVRRWR